jgi:CRP/FNR family transcriptional regulator
MQTMQNTVNESASLAQLPGEFFSKLSPETAAALQKLSFRSSYPCGITLFSESDAPKGVYVVLEGQVKLSMNSNDGKRLSLRIAKAGDLLGFVSTLSGRPCEMTAETLYPAKVAFIPRREFIEFLALHPEVSMAVAEEMSRDYALACEQLRTVGLSSNAPEKLARLLLDWSQNGQTTERGTRCRFPLTHEEIGEFIGASRETVTRTLSTFKSRRLVAFQGSMLTIPNRTALADYAHC